MPSPGGKSCVSGQAENWRPEPLFAGEECFVLGGGPSLNAIAVDALRGRRVIAVNSAGRLAQWADVLFFGDPGWLARRQGVVRSWPGLVVTTSLAAKRMMPDSVKYVLQEIMDDFPEVGSETIRWGRTSGHSSVSLAIAMGAARINLLGFDGQAVGGQTHFHGEYSERDISVYEKVFVPAWRGWRSAAQRAGVEIINLTPRSAITEFEAAE